MQVLNCFQVCQRLMSNQIAGGHVKTDLETSGKKGGDFLEQNRTLNGFPGVRRTYHSICGEDSRNEMRSHNGNGGLPIALDGYWPRCPDPAHVVRGRGALDNFDS